jgi:hypothetical protein
MSISGLAERYAVSRSVIERIDINADINVPEFRGMWADDCAQFCAQITYLHAYERQL